MATEELTTCNVCGEPVDPTMSAECNWCNSRFHLNQRNDISAKDCGKVWIDEQYMALQFACDICVDGENATDAPPRPSASKAPRAARPRRYRRRD